jgi:hypothetical protein
MVSRPIAMSKSPTGTTYFARQAASLRRAFWMDGSASLAPLSGRARTSTLAGFALIVIASPVAGLRPLWAFDAGFSFTVSWTSLPICTFSASASCSQAGFASGPQELL